MKYVLSTRNLTKKFKTFSLDGLSINIKKGEVYALIGKNGAGKTTFMKLVTGLVSPSFGEFSIMGSNYSSVFPYKYRKNVGALIEDAGFMPNLSGYDNVKAKCLCLGENATADYIDLLLKKVSLNDVRDKKAKYYSLGLKRRLGIALALVGNPDLLILDEPVNGLDPEGIAQIRELIKQLKREGKTIIISSHILDEVLKVATQIGFIEKGKLVKEISVSNLNNICQRDAISFEKYYFNLLGGK